MAVFNVSKFSQELMISEQIQDAILCINEMSDVILAGPRIGIDVFVLGFPLGIRKTGLFPIWKRASIATEYGFDINGVPSFLVDTATREGMSGAPVIWRAGGKYRRPSGALTIGGSGTQVLGIYSGRHVGKLDEAQLGIVWKTELIDQIIDDPTPGDFVLI